MHWLVTWIVINAFTVPCNPVVSPDAYGREPIAITQFAMVCTEDRDSTMIKHFSSQQDAEQFYEKGQQECGRDCKDWQLFPVQSGLDDLLEHFPDLPNDEFVIEDG